MVKDIIYYLRTSKILTKKNVYKPRQPFGTFPSKEEISTNETLLEIYEKYYKFTTTTNDSGDYMFLVFLLDYKY